MIGYYSITKADFYNNGGFSNTHQFRKTGKVKTGYITEKRGIDIMKMQTIEELAESFINGNISYVQGKVKRMSKMDFYYLLQAIVNITCDPMDEVARRLLYRKGLICTIYNRQ